MSKEYPILPIKVKEEDETLCSEDCPYLKIYDWDVCIHYRCLKFGENTGWLERYLEFEEKPKYVCCSDCRNYINNLRVLLEKANKE